MKRILIINDGSGISLASLCPETDAEEATGKKDRSGCQASAQK